MESRAQNPTGNRKRDRQRLAVLLGLLGVMVALFAATASIRENALTRAALIRHQVNDEEQRIRDERESRRLGQERLELLGQLAQDPENVRLLLRTASLYGQDRRYEDTVFLLEEARRLAPDNPEPYRALYQAYSAQSQFDRAYDYADQGLKRFPRDLELVLGRVHLDTLVGWNSDARSTLRHLDGTPEAHNPRVRVASALVYRQVTDSRHAEAEMLAAIARDPNNDAYFALLSGVQWEIGKDIEAEAAIRAALALKPDNPDYLLHLAEIQLRRRTPQSVQASLETAQRALQANPGNRNAFVAIALALNAQKRTAEAQDVLERLLARYPDHPQASYELAQIYIRNGRRAEAQRLLQQHAEGVHTADEMKSLTLRIAMLPDATAPLLALGQFYTRTDSPDKAVLVLRRALMLDPGLKTARRELAQALGEVHRSGEYGELAARPEWHIVDPLSAGV